MDLIYLLVVLILLCVLSTYSGRLEFFNSGDGINLRGGSAANNRTCNNYSR